jgi:hypothetical protein
VLILSPAESSDGHEIGHINLNFTNFATDRATNIPAHRATGSRIRATTRTIGHNEKPFETRRAVAIAPRHGVSYVG